MEPFDVGRALDEPQQLGDDRPGVQLFGCQQRKALPQVEAHLVAKSAERTGAGSVALFDAIGEHVIQQIEVGLHVARPS
jgi:hypothetical protein